MEMKIFEIHITGSQSIIEEFNDLSIKNIIIDLLTPEQKVLRTEYMSSLVERFNTYEECKLYVDKLINIIQSEIIRVKIESPVYTDLIHKSLYMESHTTYDPYLTNNIKLPLSKNQLSNKIITTDRVIDKNQYQLFESNYKKIKSEVELCLFDNFVEEDKDWFELYK